MVFEQIEKLKNDYTDKYVVVDATRPELARFAGKTGKVKTVNMSGRALVEFEGGLNIGWYDIALDFLKVVDQPLASSPKARHEAPPREQAPSAAKPAPVRPAAAPGGGKPSTADILAAARAKKEGTAAPAATTKKPSTADVLAAARGKLPAAAPSGQAGSPAKQPAAPSKSGSPAKKPSTADILAAARANKPSAAAPSAERPVAAAPVAKAVAPVAVEHPAAVAESAPEEPAVAGPAPSKPAAQGALPTTTAGKIAWCRQHDAKK